MTRLLQVFPDGGERDIADVYGGTLGPAPADRPHVTINMVASVDGATAVDGRSGILSSPTDRAILRLLRSIADVVLVGAETVRAESYGTIKADDAVRAARTARGQTPVAALAIVTKSLHLDWSSALFSHPTQRPFVIAPTDADVEALRAAERVATVIRVGSGNVDLAEALSILRVEHKVASVLCEGGPRLNTQLAGGLLDQLCLTVSPTVIGSDSTSILADVALPAPLHMELASALVEGSTLFLRYRIG